MTLDFGYGKGVQQVTLPKQNLIANLTANSMEHPRCGVDAVVYALNNPIGSDRLSALVHPGQTVAIITSDISRPMPYGGATLPILE